MLTKRRAENLEYLVNVLLEEFKKSNKQLEQLSEEHQRFLQTDYVELVADGLRKAENTRAKERIARIAQILFSVAEIGPAISLDEAEELLRIATNLSDLDVAVLREIHRAQAGFLKENQAGRVNRETANEAWRDSPPKIDGLSLVKMIKKWNQTNGKPVKPSFLLEVMALEILVPPFSGGYPYELKSFFSTAAERIGEVWADPAGLAGVY